MPIVQEKLEQRHMPVGRVLEKVCTCLCLRERVRSPVPVETLPGVGHNQALVALVAACCSFMASGLIACARSDAG